MQTQETSKPQIKIYFFLLEECKITQAYIPEINKIYKQYQSDSIDFHGYFPSPSSTDSAVQIFTEKYNLKLPWTMDPEQNMAAQFNIRVMPEVVVYDQKNSKMIYKGRIDNLFAGLGKRRNRASEHDLKVVLEMIVAGKAVDYHETQAFGCFLTRFN